MGRKWRLCSAMIKKIAFCIFLISAFSNVFAETTVVRIGSTPQLVKCNQLNCQDSKFRIANASVKVSRLTKASDKNLFLINNGKSEIEINSNTYLSIFEDGYVKEGVAFFEGISSISPDSNRLDIFTGSYKRVYDPFWGESYHVPDEGIYEMTSGASLSGKFIFIPSLNVGTANNCSSINRKFTFSDFIWFSGIQTPTNIHQCINSDVFFIGNLDYNSQIMAVVLGQKDYLFGNKLNLKPVNESLLRQIESEYNLNIKNLNAAKLEKEREESRSTWDFPVGKILAVLAGSLMTNSSSMSSSQKAEFFTAYTKDVMSGTTSNLDRFKNSYSTNKTIQQIHSESMAEINRLLLSNNKGTQREENNTNSSEATFPNSPTITENNSGSNFRDEDRTTSTNRTQCPSNTTWSDRRQACIVNITVSSPNDDGKTQIASNVNLDNPDQEVTNEYSERFSEAPALCWQYKDNKRWICHGRIQKLVVREKSQQEALRNVGCKTHRDMTILNSREFNFRSESDPVWKDVISVNLFACGYPDDPDARLNDESTLNELKRRYHLKVPSKFLRRFMCKENSFLTSDNFGDYCK